MRTELLRLGAAPALLAGLLSGCVTVYQPLVSLHRPVAIDPQLANFEGQRLLVRCLSDEHLAPPDADRLCRKLGVLFTRQGAQVDVEMPREGGAAGSGGAGPLPDLTIEIRSRVVQDRSPKLLWLLSGATLSLLPALAEHTFAQEVTIRDPAGFVLASDSLQGRFVTYFGLGVWAVSGGLDLLVRSRDEEITGGAAHRNFSRDYYRQVSQLAFDARMRSLVLRGFEAAPRSP